MSYLKDNVEDPLDAQKHALFAMRWALASVLVLVTVKLFVALNSGSAAMLGSLMDTLGDGVLSCVAYLTLSFSLKPPDAEHRYGHGKAEGMSAFLQGSFLIGSGVFLAFESVRHILSPTPLQNEIAVIAVSVFSILVTGVLVYIQKRSLKHSNSLVLEADHTHYTSDILLNAGVILALILHMYSGLIIFDALIGVAIAVYLCLSGFKVSKKATDMLMDREIEGTDRAKIIDIITNYAPISGFHDLRTRRSGMNIYISFDVELEAELSLRQAHDKTRELEYLLLEAFPNAEIIIHKDPIGDTYDTRHKVQGVHD